MNLKKKSSEGVINCVEFHDKISYLLPPPFQNECCFSKLHTN